MNKLATLVNVLPRAVQIGMVKRAQYKAGLRKQAAWSPAAAGLTGAGIGAASGLGAQYLWGDDPSATDYAMAGGAGALAGGAGGLGLQALLAGGAPTTVPLTKIPPGAPGVSVPMPAEEAYDPAVRQALLEEQQAQANMQASRLADRVYGQRDEYDKALAQATAAAAEKARIGQDFDSYALYKQFDKLLPEDKALMSRNFSNE